MKIKQGDLKLEEYLEKNLGRITSYNTIKANLSQLEADKRASTTKEVIYDKQRGVWLYGRANVGKTTLAIKSFLEKDYYEKDTTTKTYDGYKG